MDIKDILIQAIGIAAMLCSTLSFQGKQRKTVLWLQFLSNVLFFLHYVFLNAFIGAMMNIIAMLRAQVYLHRKQLRSDHPAWLVGMIAIYLAAYVMEFTVFGKELSAKNLFFSSLVIIASIIYTVGFHINDPKSIRKYNLIGAPLGLAYNLSVLSIGASCAEFLKIVSILSAMIRLDRPKREQPSTTSTNNKKESNT